ncbi:MAG: 5'-methylthioadenosine/S-adenosylhomocysteine nucleosidase [Bdellovibrionales bacterium]|nr:5'-methylthioadenosine/S-adenosylhomocysteine nucleosidase [Bdellovibrionales bacterium]
MKELGTRDLLVVVAMEEEERAVLEVLSGFPVETGEAGRRTRVPYRKFAVGERTVTLARSGIGPVNAGIAVTLLAESLAFDAILLFGVGGAVSTKLAIGDVVVSDGVFQHDSFSSLDFGNAHMPSGKYVLAADDVGRHPPLRMSGAELLEWFATVHREDRPYHRGVILSGNEFVGTVKRKREIALLHPEALLVDMEAAGVAHAAERLGLPFLVVKTVSDRLSPDGSIESDFRKCLDAAAANAATCLRALLSIEG